MRCSDYAYALLPSYSRSSGDSLETYRVKFGYATVLGMLRTMHEAVTLDERAGGGPVVLNANRSMDEIDLINWDDVPSS